jgi:Phosphoribosyl-ATP pyrophosphohydrolase
LETALAKPARAAGLKTCREGLPRTGGEPHKTRSPLGPPRRGERRGSRRKALIGEAADLLYHLLVLLAASGIDPSEVGEELLRRHGLSRPVHS